MLNLFAKLSVALIATTTLSTVVITTSQAQSSTVTYDFTVNVTKGALAGKSYNGTFSYDNSTLKGTGVEELKVAQGLTVCMNYFGRTYRETDDTSYPSFPKLVFENGKIKQLDFWIQPDKRVVWWNLPGWEVKLSRRKASSTAVPNCQKRAQRIPFNSPYSPEAELQTYVPNADERYEGAQGWFDRFVGVSAKID